MRIITWNCCMAFRNKVNSVAALKPDLAVIQECERPDKWAACGATSIHWYGHNPHKGLAVLAFGDWRLEPLAQLDAEIETVLPVRVTGPRQFNLLGVWTKPSTIPGQAYVGQIYRAVQVYADWLASAPSLVIGDFNSSTVFHKPAGQPNHNDVVADLAGLGIVSAYHHHYNCAHGAEAHPTWFMHKRTRSAFHLDYCFIPADWTSALRAVEVGALADWSPYSDHVPLVVELEV